MSISKISKERRRTTTQLPDHRQKTSSSINKNTTANTSYHINSDMRHKSKTLKTLSRIARSDTRRLNDLTNTPPGTTTTASTTAPSSSSGRYYNDSAYATHRSYEWTPYHHHQQYQSPYYHNVVDYQPDEYTPLKPEEADETTLARLLLEAPYDFSSFFVSNNDYAADQEENERKRKHQVERELKERRRVRACVHGSRYHRGKSFTRHPSMEDDGEENDTATGNNHYISKGNKRIRIAEQ